MSDPIVELRPYDSHYYVSACGDVYSLYTHKFLKHNIDLDGYHRVDIHGKHMKIHKLVYITWVGPIPHGKQINHKDDNKNNNHFTNLYAGSQKENIHDCICNGTRKGHMNGYIIFDHKKDRILFCNSVLDFIKYSGHKVANGSITRCISRKWFQKRYEIIGKRLKV